MNIEILSDCETKLKEISQIQNIPPSEIIQKALQLYIDACYRPIGKYHGGTISLEQKKKKALAAVGRFSSGISDVSVHHDEYLANAFAETGKI